MFKGRFFSSRKSGSSSPDGSNSPGSFGSNSSLGSDKRSKSAKDEFSIALRKIHVQDTSKNKVPKSQSVPTQNRSTPKSMLTASDYFAKTSELEDDRTDCGESSSPASDRATVASPILASSLGLNKIKTRSGPLPQESLFTFRGCTVEKGPGVGVSNLSKVAEDGNKMANLKKLGLQAKTGSCVDMTNDSNTMLVESASFRSQSTVAQISCSPQNAETSADDEEKQNMSWHSNSYGLRGSDGCTVQSYDCESPKESQSPRFEAVLRVTSAPRKRFPNDIKSFSHELNSKGVRPYPFWKPRGLYNIEEVLVSIRARFDKAKEEVNSDLATFAGDLVGILEKNVENHPEWQETIEDLLVLARSCAMMSPGEFWIQCEGIVQDLDDRRQELTMGMLKRLHTQMLFILTRCTRLLQFHKESRLVEDEHVLSSGQSRHTRSVDKQLPSGKESKAPAAVSGTATTKKAYSQEQHWIGVPGLHTGSTLNKRPDINISKDLELASGRDRMSSWKKFPTSKKSLESGISKLREQSDGNSQLSKEKVQVGCQAADAFPSKLIEPSEQKDSQSDITRFPKHSHKISWGYWGDQPNLSEENSIICRICEEEVPNLRVEEHSRICAIVDRCDHKGVNVDERLSIIAATLEKMTESFSQKEFQHAVGSPDATKVSNSSQTGESDAVSPKLSDQSRRCSEDMFEPELDNSVLMDDMRNFQTFSHRNLLGPKSDQGLGTSSGGSMTPRSPLLTPKASQVDLFLAGKYPEYEDLSQMNELADIARCVAHTPLDDHQSLSYLLSCLEALRVVIDRRKLDALTVETFGARIEKLIREKYFNLCELVDEEKMDITRSVIDEDTPLEDEMVRSPKQYSLHPKDRTSIEDFEIIKPISRGAFGCVFLARKRTTGDLFAIKVLKKADMIRKNAVESILAERNILISVRNRFVVRFFYSFTCRENLYLVMEYLNGGDLYSLLRNLGCLDENVARVYVAELVLALEYLHSLGVVHRDLKPDNLLIAHDGHIKLADFGLSKVGLINSTDELSTPAVCGSSLIGEDELKQSGYDHQRQRLKKRSAAGTPDYLAPEILLGTGHGTTADWWSAGVILFELIVGIPPFNAGHPQIIFDNILNGNIPWPHVPEEMSFEVQDLIRRFLTADPQQRLGARGATEVKQHIFFKDINWDTLARKKAAFVPVSESALDTSYFTSRYSLNHVDNSEDLARNEADDLSDSGRTSGGSSSCCLSNSPDDQGDYECGKRVTHLEAAPCVNYSFSNFSFKNLSQLASINYDLLTKGWKDEI